MIETYNVYEYRGDNDQSYLGCVEAKSDSEAIQSARRKYGAPVNVLKEE